MLKPLKKALIKLEHYGNHWWYPPLIGLLAFADLFVLVIPTDALIVSAVVVAPKRWIPIGLTVALGSALGCALLAHVLQVHGLPYLHHMMPGIETTSAWAWTAKKMEDWGGWGVFLVALSPIMQHPAIALAALSGMGIPAIVGLVFAGRAIKYLFIAWLSSHAPHLLKKVWVVNTEMHELELDKEADELEKRKKLT